MEHVSGLSHLKETLEKAQQGDTSNASSIRIANENPNNVDDVKIPAILQEKETGIKDYGVPTDVPAILKENSDTGYSLTGKNQDINISVSSVILKNHGRG